MAQGTKITRLGPFPAVSRPVFIASAVVIFTFIAYGALFTEGAGQFFSQVQAVIIEYFGWWYTVVVSVFLLFVVFLAFTPYGRVRLGDPDERPEFSHLSWFAMLFSAGMGIGLLFWSVAEPINHYMSPPLQAGGTPAAADTAMRLTFFHWGLHAWAVYIVVGLSLAYFAFRQKLPLSIRSVFYPLIGDRIYGPLGHLIDTFAVFGTMFGVATSLGLGVIQINAGLNYLLDVPKTVWVQVLLIAGVTAIATASVVSGLSKGIRRLSELNIALSVILLLTLLVLGPTVFLLNSMVENLGSYLQHLPEMSLWTDAIRSTGWTGDWTIFYWGWWIAWSPFVGLFIARISRGRTIREFILGALLVPALATFVWLTVFGGTALHMELNGQAAIADAVSQNVSVALFQTLDELPWRLFTASLATLIIVTYFVTSSDSGSLVIDMLTAGGHTDPPKIQRLFWAITEGVVASVLLIAGGLTALQTAAVSSGLPFSVIMLLMCFSLMRALRTEPITPTAEELEPDAPRNPMGSGD